MEKVIVSYDVWRGSTYDSVKKILEGVNDVDEYINYLDGQKTTLLTVEADENNYMVVGGGNNGKYFCYLVAEDNEDFMSPVTKEVASEAFYNLVMGGQETEIEAKYCCTRLETLEITKHYLQSRLPHPGYKWEAR